MGAGRAIRREVARLGLGARTTFTGLLRGRERLEALAAADVLVYPSRQEAFGLVPIEALMCGTPVVVADDSGCAEVVRETGGGVVVAEGDSQALASAIQQMLVEPSRFREQARSARARAASRFSSDQVCADLERVYSEVID